MNEIKILEKLNIIEEKINNRLFDKWLNIKEVSNYTSLSDSTIRRAVQKGVLKVSRKTGKLLFNTEDVKRWLNG